jgi:DNA-binding MarR family transcriptional regulator
MRDNGINSILFRNALARKLNLTVTESMCLSLLGIKGTSTPTELAHYTGLTSGSTTTMLDRLEKAQFITRKPNPNDRRGVLIEINKQYTEITGPLVAGIQKAQKELIASYSEKELKIITDFLTKFTSNVIEQTKKVEHIK